MLMLPQRATAVVASSLRFPCSAPPGKRRDTSGYPAKLQSFIQRLMPSLVRVTHLTVEVHFQRAVNLKSSTTSSNCLIQLARAFPNVHHLSLSGDISETLLRALGAGFEKLTSLEALQPGIPLSTMENLQSRMPGLTSFKLQRSPDNQETSAEALKYMDSVLAIASSLPLLTNLSMPSLPLACSSWNSLPPGLLQLHVDAFVFIDDLVAIPGGGSAFEDFHTMHCLQHLSFALPEANIPIEWLVSALQLSPNITELTLGAAIGACEPPPVGTDLEGVRGVDCECDEALVVAVAYLNGRLAAGLEVTSHVTDSVRLPQHLALYLHLLRLDSDVEGFDDEEQAISSICSFLDALPECGAITSVTVTMLPVHSDTHWDDLGNSKFEDSSDVSDSGGEDEQSADRSERGSGGSDSLSSHGGGGESQPESSIPNSLARAFPGVRVLHLQVGVKRGQTVTDLQLFHELESLTLSHLKHMSNDLVDTLFASLPTPCELHVLECKHVPDTNMS